MGCGTSRQRRVHPSQQLANDSATPPPASSIHTPPVLVQSIGVQTDEVQLDEPQTGPPPFETPHQQRDEEEENEPVDVIVVHPVEHSLDENLDSTMILTAAATLVQQDEESSTKKDTEYPVVERKQQDEILEGKSQSSLTNVELSPSHTTAEQSSNGRATDSEQPVEQMESVLAEKKETKGDDSKSVNDSSKAEEVVSESKEYSSQVIEEKEKDVETSLKPSIDELTPAISDARPPNEASTVSNQFTAPPNEPIDDGDVKTTEQTATPSRALNPIPPLNDTLTATSSEPRLPVLPPIKKQAGSNGLKSKSASDMKRHSAGRGDSNGGKNKRKTPTSRSTSGSSLSRSRDGSENVVKKSTSRESLRSGSQTHLKSSSSSLLQKNSGVSLSSKKLSLSRESLKAANLVYTSSKSRESLKSGSGKLSSKSKESLRSNDKGKRESITETKPTVETEKPNESTPTATTEDKAEEKNEVKAEETQTEAKERPREPEGQTQLGDENQAAAEGREEEEDEAGKEEHEEEKILETKFEIDHHTGQSEQSIVEAVEKSLTPKESQGDPLPAAPDVQTATTTVQ